MATLGLLLPLGLDKVFAVRVLGWELEERTGFDYHFHRPPTWDVVRPYDYRILNSLFDDKD